MADGEESGPAAAPAEPSAPPERPVEPPPKPTGRSKAASLHDPLKAAFLAASLTLLSGMGIGWWTNYLTRRDQHVQEADQCNGLAASFVSTTSYAYDAAQAAADSLAAPLPSHSMTYKFVLPAIDEILHAQDQFLNVVDPKSRNAILQLEAYYRAIRDDLSNSPNDVTHQGETFSLLASSPNRIFYETLLRMIAREAQEASDSLATTTFCDDLAETELFGSHIRRYLRRSAP